MPNNERLRIPLPIVVEGRYDKIKLASIAEANILTTAFRRSVLQ